MRGTNLEIKIISSRAENLEPICCKNSKKSPNQETGLGIRGPLEALIDTKLILNH